MSRSHFDAVIIGSGISSLTSAILLAQRGLSVCVLEQYKKPGGYLHSFKRFGHTFETGAHYSGALGPREPFHTLLTALGVYDANLFEPLDPSGFDVFSFPHARFEFPVGIPAILESLLRRFPLEALGIHRYFDLVEEAVGYFQTYRFSLDRHLMGLQKFLDTSLESIVSSCVSDGLLKSILFGHCYLHGVKPRDISFGLHALVVDSTYRSPHGFRGGGDALADKYVKKIVSLGGEVRVSSRVSRLATAGKKVERVELESGESLYGSVIISGSHPKATLRLLSPDSVPVPFARRVNGFTESGSIFGIYADASGATDISRLKNYYYFSTENPDELLRENENPSAPSVVFVSRPDRSHSTNHSNYPLIFHAPGPKAWFADWKDSSMGSRPAEYRTYKSKLAENILQFTAEREPTIAEIVRKFETSTALTNEHFNGSEDGSGYGIYHSMNATGLRAIGPRTPIKNLFLAGQSALMPGLLGASLSGVRAAGMVVGLDSILTNLISVRDS